LDGEGGGGGQDLDSLECLERRRRKKPCLANVHLVARNRGKERKNGPHLDLGTLVGSHVESNLGHTLLHHSHANRSPGIRVHAFFCDQTRDLLPKISELMIPFLFTDLELSFCQNLLDNVRDGGGVEGFLELRGWRESTFGNVGEDVGDLEDLVDIFLAGMKCVKR
jgi:hypothetical protein